MATEKTQAAKDTDATTYHWVPGNIYAFAILKTHLIQEIVLVHAGMYCLLLPKKSGQLKSI